ncbi:hypothetical protein PS870_00496 [Pseudomonas fluorescens]|uniref:Uncharacterized protein n=1 Tax=Pseudomonas fluorescens TaxID=294 RepID=A0A5E7GT99_PSEFL|nr:hypothetical protein PS870_00496 [Pseudomonas fluorescens]
MTPAMLAPPFVIFPVMVNLSLAFFKKYVSSCLLMEWIQKPPNVCSVGGFTFSGAQKTASWAVRDLAY